MHGTHSQPRGQSGQCEELVPLGPETAGHSSSRRELQEAMEDQIARYVERHDSVTFAGLVEHLTDLGCDARGDVAISLGHRNVVVWDGLSAVLRQALAALVDSRRVEIEPCSLWEYVVDGILLDLPTISELADWPEDSPDQPHWVPTVLQVPTAGVAA